MGRMVVDFAYLYVPRLASKCWDFKHVPQWPTRKHSQLLSSSSHWWEELECITYKIWKLTRDFYTALLHGHK